jgi:outer membrane lipoprotein-sorting protein
MKTKLLLALALVLTAGQFNSPTVAWCADELATNVVISPQAEKILRLVADYYQNLTSFEGAITRRYQSPSLKAPSIFQKQFAFLRPNKFYLSAENQYNSELFCDGTNFWECTPSYFNSYTKTPAPARFENALTNWLGGELLHVMVDPNRYHYMMTGFRMGMAALKYDGEEAVAGVTCDHLTMEAPGSKSSELWVAKGGSPFIVKLAIRFPVEAFTNQMAELTETITGWKANQQIPNERFVFVPPATAIEHPPGADAVAMSLDPRTGQPKTRFYNPASRTDSNVALSQPDGTNASVEISGNVMMGSNSLGRVSVRLQTDYSNFNPMVTKLLGTNYAPALAYAQTNLIPAMASLPDSEFGAAGDFLTDLKKQGALPGISKDVHGSGTVENFTLSQLENPTYPFTATFSLIPTDGSFTNHYTVVRPSKGAPWRLEKAWGTDGQGRTLVEWPVKSATTKP